MPAYNCWEYYVFVVDMDESPNKDEFDKLERELNELGRAGWDIAATFPQDGMIIFKKPTDAIEPYTGSHIRRTRPERRDRRDDDDEQEIMQLGGK